MALRTAGWASTGFGSVLNNILYYNMTHCSVIYYNMIWNSEGFHKVVYGSYFASSRGLTSLHPAAGVSRIETRASCLSESTMGLPIYF